LLAGQRVDGKERARLTVGIAHDIDRAIDDFQNFAVANRNRPELGDLLCGIRPVRGGLLVLRERFAVDGGLVRTSGQGAGTEIAQNGKQRCQQENGGERGSGSTTHE